MVGRKWAKHSTFMWATSKCFCSVTVVSLAAPSQSAFGRELDSNGLAALTPPTISKLYLDETRWQLCVHDLCFPFSKNASGSLNHCSFYLKQVFQLEAKKMLFSKALKNHKMSRSLQEFSIAQLFTK